MANRFLLCLLLALLLAASVAWRPAFTQGPPGCETVFAATSRGGGKKGGGQKVQFGVIFYFFNTGIFGEGNLDSTGMWIDTNKAHFIDFDIGFRLRGKLSLPVLPPPE